MLLILDDVHKKHLEFLKQIDNKVVKEFCRIAIEHLQKGANVKVYQVAAQKLNVEADLVQNAVNGIANLFTEAAKVKATEIEFRDSILILGFSKECEEDLVSCYKEHEQEIRLLLSSFEIGIPHYRNLEWRVDVQVASRSLRKPCSPTVLMCLELQQDEKNSRKLLETDPVNLIHMTEVLDQALQEAKSQHARRVIRSVK